GGKAGPLWPPGRHHDPAGLPPRTSSFRALRSAMAPGRDQHRPAARPQEQKGHAVRASDAGRRNPRPKAPAARAGGIAVLFTSERGGPMSAKSFGTLFERLGKRAGMPFTI